MGSFIPHDNQSDVPAGIDPIEPHDDFFPTLLLTTYRKVMRVDDTVSNDRAIDCLESAMLTIINDITTWRDGQSAKNIATLPDTKSKVWQKTVFHRAKALSIEKYRDIDTTGDGENKADAMEDAIDTYIQRSREFQRILTDKPRTTIRLV